MKKLIYIIVLVFLMAVGTNAQNCATVEECRERLSSAVQMLNKALDVSDAQEKAIVALKEEIESRKRLQATQEAVIINQDKLITTLQKETRRKFSILWGIVSIRF